ncbi:ferrous iron transport protein A [Paraeggerthella hongkongensis]|jgi:ferrous iron transport protein A|nr:ferrous iron transport protein A [Paraeggerthella hongkongensis]
MGVDMDNAVAASTQGAISQASVPSATVHQMPLSFLRSGEVAVIAKVRGKGELRHHLETLGFVEGVQVQVVAHAAGDLIVEIKGSQVALSQQVASRIITAA